MSPRKNHFEVVQLANIAPLLEGSHRVRILSVSYDPSLAHTREMLFTSVGFEVATFLDVHEAIAACQSRTFDLVIVGHSIPLPQKKTLLRELRRLCATPVLAMVRHGEPRLLEADYFFDPLENPALFVETVINIVRSEYPRN